MHHTKTTPGTRLLSFIMALVMTVCLLPAKAFAANAAPAEIKQCSRNVTSDFKIDFSTEATDWLDAITSVTVGDTVYKAVEYSSLVWYNTHYYVNTSEVCLLIGAGFEGDSATCVISAEGYADLTLKLTKGDSYTAEILSDSDTGGEGESDSNPETSEKPAAPMPKFTINFSSDRYELAFDKVDYVSGISGVLVNSAACKQGSSASFLSGTQYFCDERENSLYLASKSWTSAPTFQSGDVITVQNPNYQDLVLKLTIVNGEVKLAPDDGEAGDGYTLHIRLVGTFEAAIVNQKDYDAITGATGSVTSNKNSNAEVQGALVVSEEEPAESDWKPLHECNFTVDGDKDKTYAVISANGEPVTDMGMVAVYNHLDSALTLAGTPEKAGKYAVSVTVTDDQGRTATSNSLPFCVYSGNEALATQLTLENCKQTADGKYMYDMEPWTISKFGSTNEEVTVPAAIKAWYGSHTSGTYGILGYFAQDEQTTQTLRIPDGCDLTMVNMDLLSSVKVIVESGGKLTLRDSVTEGIIEVQDGGTFSMNYDPYSGDFLYGASTCGQILLQDGAILENASIYSNRNYLANGQVWRTTNPPVVQVNGNVTVKGRVFIRGDEANTYTDGIGQTALAVKNGTLTLQEGAVLAVYGGGDLALTKTGAPAVTLENGTITGNGKLIAVGGEGYYGAGGNAVQGTGTISTDAAYLHGGSVFDLASDKTAVAGLAASDGVTVAETTAATQKNGVVYSSTTEDANTPRWTGTSVPTDEFMNAHYGNSDNGDGEKAPDGTVIVDGKDVSEKFTLAELQDKDGEWDFEKLNLANTEIFADGAAGAYLVTLGDETRLLGDLTLSGKWVGTWESWQNYIYPSESVAKAYPYLDEVWELAYKAYIAAFYKVNESMGQAMEQQFPDAAALKAYWDAIADTKEVAQLRITKSEDSTGYQLTWVNANGAVLASDTYVMTGKLLKGFEGAAAYVFTAQTLSEDSPYRYFVSMDPGIEGTETQPISAHYHFQFGCDLSQMLLKGQLYNSTDYGTNETTQRPIASNLTNTKWYATMIDAGSSSLAKYNVILGMHQAEKWSQLPSPDTSDTGSGSSSSSSSSSYSILNPAVQHGTVSIAPRRAEKGDTVTITVQPDRGYALAELTATTRSGKILQLNDLGNGKYTFTMPAGQVTVNAVFQAAEASATTSFADVSKDSYYYDAVLWAVENGITSGISADTFLPGAACTRAQTVTFLWRAMGSPEPKTSVNPFTDVSADAYYYKAVLWASEQGVTSGTGENRFSPQTVVNRSQTVTFLWRAAGMPDAKPANSFADVTAGDYYASAAQWAAGSGVTNGVSATAFAPGAACTRAQIVTFLYRYMQV